MSRAHLFLMHDLFDVAQHPVAQRQPGIDPGAGLLDHACAQHVAVRDDLRLGGRFLEHGQEVAGQAHVGPLGQVFPLVAGWPGAGKGGGGRAGRPWRVLCGASFAKGWRGRPRRAGAGLGCFAMPLIVMPLALAMRGRKGTDAGQMIQGTKAMGIFEKFLSVWIALAMLAGIALGNLAPGLVAGVAAAEVASVNLVVAVLIWAMVYPMMVGVDPGSLRDVARQPRGLAITLVVNWLIKPFTMAALGVLFFEVVFADLIAPEDAQQYIAGLILLGAAPCTAMVFVWSQLTRGDESYTLLQVSVNDVVMVFAFAPIVAFLLGVTDIAVPWETLVLSVILFVALPLAAGLWTRARLGSAECIEAFRNRVKPWSVVGLIAAVVILFGLQGQTIIDRPEVIALIAVPILIQSYGIFALAYAAAWAWNVPHRIAAPCALIGTSNFFELAVAVAISLSAVIRARPSRPWWGCWWRCR